MRLLTLYDYFLLQASQTSLYLPLDRSAWLLILHDYSLLQHTLPSLHLLLAQSAWLLTLHRLFSFTLTAQAYAYLCCKQRVPIHDDSSLQHLSLPSLYLPLDRSAWLLTLHDYSLQHLSLPSLLLAPRSISLASALHDYSHRAHR